MAKSPAQKTEQKTEATPPARRSASPLSDLHAEIDRLFGDFSQRFPGLWSGRSLFDWEPLASSGSRMAITAPQVDVTETDKAVEIVAELPGIEEKDISLEIKEDVLTLSGEKKEETSKDEKDYHLSERRFGSFRRSFRLPAEIDTDKTSATFKDGVLKVTLPKTAKAQEKARKISIKSK